MNMIHLGFLASGRGSNMQAIINACAGGALRAEPVVVISNNPDAGALIIAKNKKIPNYHLSSKTHPDPKQLDKTITETLNNYQADLIVLAGYMKQVGPVLLKEYKNRVINIHPSLLPRHGGKEMYGMNVHRAVIEAGEKETGATVHLVNDKYDEGLILAQRKIDVATTDTAESLAERVLEVEHSLYTEVLQDIVSGKILLPQS